MAAPDLGKSWDRFLSGSLGEWTGRCLALSPEGKLLHSLAYFLSTTGVKPTKSNPASVLVAAAVSPDGQSADQFSKNASDIDHSLDLRYDTSSLYVFEDGSFTATHRLVSLGRLLPRAQRIPISVEHSLVLSATERVRCFANYTSDSVLESVLLLEETRQGLFENREPLAFTSLLGDWSGEAEALQRPDPGRRDFTGFGRGRLKAPPPPPRFSKEDLPDELKHPSSAAADGLIRFQTTVGYGWDPSGNALRRTTKLSDLQGVELGASTVYGNVVAEEGALFDIVRCTDDSLLFALSNACFMSVPQKRARGIVTTSELGCLITPNCRRRIQRTNARWGVASESLVTESRSFPG